MAMKGEFSLSVARRLFKAGPDIHGVLRELMVPVEQTPIRFSS